ncbi:helicase IV [Thermomonas fusca]|uniref:DNA 3'-5' helicase n=2 Tax=Thermomonas fusca TaxID=215690 RepID=A0A5R9PBW0_9GAMM|nr:UvrD-helicase domain-containing protein [Thermomonas fusca]TLX20955.1 helicase IV [Thermomonas fusca]
MPTWKPSKLRKFLFKGTGWSFASDSDSFSLSIRGQATINAPLIHIRAFAYRRMSSVPANGECKFVLFGEKVDRPLCGLNPSQGDELRDFLAQCIASCLISHAQRGKSLLDAWKHSVDQRLQHDGYVDTPVLRLLYETIPSPRVVGLNDWNALFGHPHFLQVRNTKISDFPALRIAPDAYLREKVEGHNQKIFDRQLEQWAKGIRQHLSRQGWIGYRAAAKLCTSEWSPPEMPGKEWESAVNEEFQPSPQRWVERQVAAHNKSHEEAQLVACRPFFDRVESNPLTEEQSRAVICMDDELLVVAAAGSGKSSTIVAKAGYALEQRLCAPEEILLLAFNTAAAEELRQRIAKRLAHLPGADRIVAKTFHAFGLEVIGEGTGAMPTPAGWLDHGQDVSFIGKLVDELCAESSDFSGDYNLFRLVFARGLGRWDTEEEPEDYDPDSRRKRGFRTMRNEIVKSKGERLIADWLFLHGVNYEYERPYEIDTRTPNKRQYRPDFYYPDIGLYHEHLALDAKGEPPASFKGYAEAVAWKRATHRDHNTELFETTSHDLRTGRALATLKAKLEEKGLLLTLDPNREIPGRNPDSPQSIAKLLRTFQQHMKGSRQTITAARERIAKMQDVFVPRMDLFLSLYERVSDRWERRLQAGGFVDFDDMLNRSADLIEAGQYKSKAKMILADEFQDSSRARMRLVQAVIDTTGAQLTAVGDDWQGIYRFAGADIAIMSHFQRRYPNANIRYLSQTFRCPGDLCEVSSRFVSKNPMQIPKEVRTSNPRLRSSIKVFALPDVKDIPGKIGQQLETIHDQLPDAAPGQRLKVLILGRYNKDRPAQFTAWRQRLGARIALEFLTVHKAKGLEADVVFVLNVTRGRHGFPSEVEDDPILQMAMPEPEAFPFGEERRLFYVALTRAKRTVVLYTASEQPSEFIVELQNDYGVEILRAQGVPAKPCPTCGKGVVVERVNAKTNVVFEGCSRFPACPPLRRQSGVMNS